MECTDGYSQAIPSTRHSLLRKRISGFRSQRSRRNGGMWSEIKDMRAFKQFIGGTIFFGGMILGALCALFGLGTSVPVLKNDFGLLVMIFCLLGFPFTAIIGPIYTGMAHSNWTPVLVVYGGAILTMVLMAIGAFLGTSRRKIS